MPASYGTPDATATEAEGGGIDGTDIRGPRPLVVNFTNQSSGASTYSWDFGDGGNSTQTNPQHQYSDLGIFDVVLTITDPVGGGTFTHSSYVTVGCLVPNFSNHMTDTAAAAWSTAGFTGPITYQPVGANGSSGKSSSPPQPPRLIQSQEDANGGSLLDPIQQNKNAPWLCSQSVNLRYVP